MGLELVLIMPLVGLVLLYHWAVVVAPVALILLAIYWLGRSHGT